MEEFLADNSVALALLGWTGLMVWWMSQKNTEMKQLREDRVKDREEFTQMINEHIEDDHRIHRQLNDELNRREFDAGRLLELKLANQSNELIIRFRDLMHSQKREWGDEFAQAAYSVFQEWVREHGGEAKG